MAAPWVLLTLWHRQPVHAYEIGKILETAFCDIDVGLNLTGLYRHLKQLEKRGMVVSQWEYDEKGPPRRRYALTEAGRECLWRWMNTLTHQMLLLDRFFEQAEKTFPNAPLPRIIIQSNAGKP
jgi:DNA-binding PadR family transcriptional regulator